MLFSFLTQPTLAKRAARSSVAALAIGSLFATASLVSVASVAKATDLDFSTGSTAQDDANFLRIGLFKSAVIKLPTAAADVIVGNPAVVDVVIRNKNTAYLFGNSAAQTNVFFFDANGQEILHLDLEVTLDGKGAKKLIDRTIPGNSIQVDTTVGNIVLKGTAANAEEAKLAEDLAAKFVGDPAKVVNTLQIAEGDQVMLKVRVVELKRTIMKQLGVNLNARFSVGNFGVGFNSAPVPINEDSILDVAGRYVSSNFRADMELRALESEGLAKTLAEPTLTAVSGSPAAFHAGGEYPYSVCRTPDNGVRYCDVEFKPYGVSLSFTPTVMNEGRIGLKIRTEVSDIAQITDGSQPVIDTRNAETTVELPSGGSMMLAGLIKDVTAQDLAGTPGLRKVPILGALFNSRAYQKNESELVVIVTPYIVNPARLSDLKTPADRLNSGTDRQAILFGRLNRVYGAPGKHPQGVYHGNVGYIIE